MSLTEQYSECMSWYQCKWVADCWQSYSHYCPCYIFRSIIVEPAMIFISYRQICFSWDGFDSSILNYILITILLSLFFSRSCLSFIAFAANGCLSISLVGLYGLSSKPTLSRSPIWFLALVSRSFCGDEAAMPCCWQSSHFLAEVHWNSWFEILMFRWVDD